MALGPTFTHTHGRTQYWPGVGGPDTWLAIAVGYTRNTFLNLDAVPRRPFLYLYSSTWPDTDTPRVWLHATTKFEAGGVNPYDGIAIGPNTLRWPALAILLFTVWKLSLAVRSRRFSRDSNSPVAGAP